MRNFRAVLHCYAPYVCVWGGGLHYLQAVRQVAVGVGEVQLQLEHCVCMWGGGVTLPASSAPGCSRRRGSPASA